MLMCKRLSTKDRPRDCGGPRYHWNDLDLHPCFNRKGHLAIEETPSRHSTVEQFSLLIEDICLLLQYSLPGRMHKTQHMVCHQHGPDPLKSSRNSGSESPTRGPFLGLRAAPQNENDTRRIGSRRRAHRSVRSGPWSCRSASPGGPAAQAPAHCWG